MSRIQELIKEKCPNGVEYKSIKDIFDLFSGMTGVSNKWSDTGNCKFIDYMNVYRNNKIDVNLKCNATVKNLNQTTLKKGDILLTSASETADECAISSVVESEIEDETFMDDHLFGLRLKNDYSNKINTTFINYYFSSKIFRNKLYKAVRGVTRFYVSNKDFIKLLIPIPPLEVQEEIVRILDKFSSNGLESLLTLELELRREQYEYYLKRTFKSVSGKKVALGSVVTFNRGKRVVKKDLENDKTSNLFPVYQNSLIPLGYYDKSNFDCKKTIIISAGAAGKIGFVEEKIWAADDCLRCLCSNEILDKYLYYFLKSNESYIQSMVRKASVPRISANVFEKMEIIIPSIDIQRKIIEIFDRFEKIINNVNDGLPAEIELRRQQYEYYRNKLLSFEELSVSE